MTFGSLIAEITRSNLEKLEQTETLTEEAGVLEY